VIVLAGQKQAAGTKHTFEYPAEEPTSFAYNDRYYATGNDTVATYLGADAISGMDEIKVEKLDDGQIRITSKQWTLNLQDMVKRVKSYEIKSDEQTTQLCEQMAEQFTNNSAQPQSTNSQPVQMEELPLFRLVRGNDHFYTTNCSEKNDAVTRYGYSYEGVQAYVFSSPGSHIVPLYRLYNSSIHFYTADQNEEQQDLRSGWQLEGTMGYVASAPQPNLVPLYRSRASNGGYLYTTDLHEWNSANANGGISEGITGWVVQNHDDPCGHY
jgi:hypothetical protein